MTKREFDVLRLLEKGMSNYQIAYELGIRTSTAKTHIYHIARQLHAQSRVEIVVKAYYLGLLEKRRILSPIAQTIVELLNIEPTALADLIELGIVKVQRS